MEVQKKINRDMLKFIAIIPMAVGHFCGYLFDGGLPSETPFVIFFLTRFALFAPPIFFFFIAEGFRYTRSPNKYAFRLLIFALITQIPFCLANSGTLLTVNFFLNLNIFFTLFLGLISLIIWESKLNLSLRIILIVLMDVQTVVLQSEWMILGIPAILGFYIMRDRPKARFLWFSVCMLSVQIISIAFAYSGFWGFVGAAIEFLSTLCAYFVVTKCCNGEKGKHPKFSKWFFYFFYPLHLIVIYLFKLAIGKF